jgi:leucyl-tRNA synthetase
VFEPIKIADYFHKEIKSGMIEMGYSIDWRREFTTILPGYQKFIEWQITTLKENNKIIQGSHPVGWCPRDQNPVSQHDTMGDVEPKIDDKNFLIKFVLDEFIFPVTTLRPETIFGITNLWVNPNTIYKKVSVDNETWIVSEECAKKIEFFEKKVSIIGEIPGNQIIGKYAKNHDGREIPILPAEFVESSMGTGLVMSVPAHAPKDYQALMDLRLIHDYWPSNPSMLGSLLEHVQVLTLPNQYPYWILQILLAILEFLVHRDFLHTFQ